MKRLLKIRAEASERGQAMILVAILMPALMGILGLAVEGGRTLVEYRKLQSAADMAAIVGAQTLPCKRPDSGTTSCITTAETQACAYATDNGYSCTTAKDGTLSAYVPPVTCSPYDFIDYGNGDENCKSAGTPQFYDYIEVRLTDNLGTIPIFNTPVTLSAHAVAKRGGVTGNDFALISLSKTTPLTINGNNTLQVYGSVASNDSIAGTGSSAVETCSGGFFAPGSITGVVTDTNGSNEFGAPNSPPSCTGTADSTADTQTNFPIVTDPYASSSPPPTQPAGSSFTSCPECSQPGVYWNLDSKTWLNASTTTPSGDVELFPGIYSTINLGNNNTAYFNPGVYTFTQPIDLQHGQMCVFGAPECNATTSSPAADCPAAQFTPPSSTGDSWNYQCSPYGYWDSSRAATAPSSLTQPMFIDATTDLPTTTPLNGVTLYLTSTSGVTRLNGNASKGGGTYLAAPDPCPGTGSSTSNSVSFPAGSTTGTFTYDSTYLANNPLITTLPAATSPGSVYPSQDWSLLAECNNNFLVWPGEMTKPQHLHFLIYDPQGTNGIAISGASTQQFTGIFYAPSDNMTVDGTPKNAGGPPWLNGQLVINSATLTGGNYEDISYRSCAPGATGCGYGTGTELVQ